MGDSDKSDMVVVGTNGEVDGEGGVKTVNKRIIAQKVCYTLAWRKTKKCSRLKMFNEIYCISLPNSLL